MNVRYGLIGLLFVMIACTSHHKKQSFIVESSNSQASAFWQGFDYSDESLLKDTFSLQKAFYAWMEMLKDIKDNEAERLIEKWIMDGNGHPEMQLQLMGVAEFFLNDPNSPFREEELYIPMLEAIIRAPSVEEDAKTRYHFQHRMAMKNRKGTQAEDFRYITSSGEQGTLHQWSHDYILLYFFNPECHDCARVKAYIGASTIMGKLQQAGKLKVLAIYPDEDMGAWNRHVGENPNEWVTARYSSMDEAEAFYLPAIPNLYLLDKDKKVLLKDAPIERIEQMLIADK